MYYYNNLLFYILLIILWTFNHPWFNSPLYHRFYRTHLHGVSLWRRRPTDTPRWDANCIHMKTNHHKKQYSNKNEQKSLVNLIYVWWLVYNSTRAVQRIYFLSTIKPQLVSNRETCDYYWTFLGIFGQKEYQNWLEKSSKVSNYQNYLCPHILGHGPTAFSP